MIPYQIDRNDQAIYPMGLTTMEDGIHISVTAAAKACSLVLFAHGKKAGERPTKIPFPDEGRMGDVWEMTVRAEGLSRFYYAIEADGKLLSDPCGHVFAGNEIWGSEKQVGRVLRTPIAQREFDWEGDRPLHIPYENCIVYRVHVRGFTKHSSSGVNNQGKFAGVMEKIPYLADLGITTLELMVPQEFGEVMVHSGADGSPYAPAEPQPTGRINYWGYGPTFLFAPKASYSCGDPETELKKLVKTLHRAGMELVIELHFTGQETPAMALEAARHWVREYHVDGIHLTGQAPTWLLAGDPYLADTKLWAASWDGMNTKPGQKKRLAEYNDDFQTDMRRVLKGDEDQMNSLIFRNRRNPASWGVINYMANTNGFTLMDLVSYEQKHNEQNGENNRDGAEYNYSWNCGTEGPTRKKKLVTLRKKQIKNALLLLFLSQGTPLLLAGDEFGNSQGGNNNAYCQDNETSWLNWGLLRTNQEIFDFTKHLIAFRKAHPVFHMPVEPRVMDYLACGHPDISYHGLKAWFPEFENFRRQMGIMYCGEYGLRPDGSPDDYFFVTYNMHWEPHEFALPNLPKGRQWKIAFCTDDKETGGYFPDGKEKEPDSQKKIMVPPRTVIVFIGKEA